MIGRCSLNLCWMVIPRITLIKLLSVPLLNRRLAYFNFLDADAVVRPLQLKFSLDKLSGSASQNWCLLCIIPLIIDM
jgi:hypothetical protein